MPRIDKAGLLISVAGLGLLTYTIIEAPGRGWTSLLTLLGFTGAAVLVVAFVLVERAVEHPMLDVSLFNEPRFSAASGAVTIWPAATSCSRNSPWPAPAISDAEMR